jgi:hypothetical protein
MNGSDQRLAGAPALVMVSTLGEDHTAAIRLAATCTPFTKKGLVLEADTAVTQSLSSII